MKELIVKELKKQVSLPEEVISDLIEIPPTSDLGDYSFPCFVLSKELKKNPSEISHNLSLKIKSDNFEKVESKGPYLNFFLNRNNLVKQTISRIKKEKDKYGSSKLGKGKKIVIEMSSPNIAKPFGIGHLRSTIIGNSISNISFFLGYKTIKINYLGDWGTPFGKILLGFKKYGSESKLKKEPIKHLFDLYVKVNEHPELEQEARDLFKRLESGDKKTSVLWKKFKDLSLKDFNKLYSILNIKFNVISSESIYNKKMPDIVKKLEKNNLIRKSQGAWIVDLEEYGLGIVLIKKSDDTTLYATRDLAAAIDRYKKYNFEKMIYEVGSEQKLHFKQIFKILDLMGYKWAGSCVHVDHGLYLDEDGKKFSTRKGKTIFMEDILKETIDLAKKEISKREKLSKKELEFRAKKIALAAIFYGDLKNHRSNDVIFDVQRFVSFEGNTGPYLLYTYARAKSILKKSKKGKSESKNISETEKSLVLLLSRFPEVVLSSYTQLSPNLIANYAYDISQKFNEFYHMEKVIGAENEDFKRNLVLAFSQVLKNSLSLLGIQAIEKM